jgi:hypothetical protein
MITTNELALPMTAINQMPAASKEQVLNLKNKGIKCTEKPLNV